MKSNVASLPPSLLCRATSNQSSLIITLFVHSFVRSSDQLRPIPLPSSVRSHCPFRLSGSFFHRACRVPRPPRAPHPSYPARVTRSAINKARSLATTLLARLLARPLFRSICKLAPRLIFSVHLTQCRMPILKSVVAALACPFPSRQ